MGIRAKGSTQIRTLAGIRASGTHSSERHVHQFQIATLELERTRRMQERQAAIHRVEKLELRLAEIDAQIRQRQEVLGSTAGAAGTDSRMSQPTGLPPATPAPRSSENKKPRTLRY